MSVVGGLGGPGARTTAPRAPRSEELRSDNAPGPASGPGAVQEAVQARSQWGSGLVQAVHPLSTYSRVKKRRERNRATTWTTWTTETGDHHDCEASRPGVHPQRGDRACSRAPRLEARQRGQVLAARMPDPSGSTLGRGSRRPERRSRAVEPGTRVRALQPLGRRAARCCADERATWRCSPVAHGPARLDRRARALVTTSDRLFFAGRSYPRLRLQEPLFPLNWSIR